MLDLHQARIRIGEFSDLAVPIEKLLKDLFWTKCLAGLLVLSLVAVLVAGRTKHPKVVEATQFVLKDDAGKVLAKLGPEPFGATCLTLSTKADPAASQLCVANDGGSWLELNNAKTVSHVLLTPGSTGYEPNAPSSSDSGPIASLFNGAYHPVGTVPADLVIEDHAFSSYLELRLSDFTEAVFGHGKNQAVVVSANPDESSIQLYGPEGKPTWSSH